MAVDPMKRLTVSQVLDHPWTKLDTPRYLRRLHRRHAQPPLESLSSLLTDVTLANDPDYISGIGKLDIPITLELAEGIGVASEEIRNALRLPGENAVKVAYLLCSDRKYRHDCKQIWSLVVLYSTSAQALTSIVRLYVVNSSTDPEQDDSEQSSTIEAPLQILPLTQIVSSCGTFAILHRNIQLVFTFRLGS